ncbi:MAG: hypothetical protein IH897_03535 [Planctomycetes bacterium]|nr:hypothetical protein [Planctomycetota bacterium]
MSDTTMRSQIGVMKVVLLVSSVASLGVLAAAAFDENFRGDWRPLQERYATLLASAASDSTAREAAAAFPVEKKQLYLEELNRNNVLVIGIESVPAVERLEELISVPGVDGAFVGPNDLSIQLGVPNKYDHPKFLETMIHIHETCRAKGVPLVIHLFNHDMAAYWINKGIHFILYGTDRRALSEGFIADFEALRYVNGGKVKGGKASKHNAPRARAKLTVVHSKKGPYS